VILQPHQVVSRTYITCGDNGRGRVLAEGEVRVSDKVVLKWVALVKLLVFNLLFVTQVLEEDGSCFPCTPHQCDD
jgi:hypothetical protein